MRVVIISGSCYELPPECFNKPVTAIMTRDRSLVRIPKSELIRIGAVKPDDNGEEAGLNFFMDFEVRRIE